jgi:hypothetical protein
MLKKIFVNFTRKSVIPVIIILFLSFYQQSDYLPLILMRKKIYEIVRFEVERVFSQIKDDIIGVTVANQMTFIVSVDALVCVHKE